MKERLLNLFLEICQILCFKDIYDKADTNRLISEGDMVKFLEKLKEFFDKKRERLFTFKDTTNRSLLKCYILDFRGEENIDGTPVIIINDFPLGLKGDKNPVLNLELRYDDVEDRDSDLADLRLLLK